MKLHAAELADGVRTHRRLRLAIADYFVDVSITFRTRIVKTRTHAFLDHVSVRERRTLRYGENPHQKAAFYAEPDSLARASPPRSSCTARSSVTTTSSTSTRAEPRPRVRGAGVRRRQAQQPLRGGDVPRSSPTPSSLAWDGDPLSAFGGIIAFNKPVDADTASAIMDPKAKRFVECVIAPDYEPHALDALKKWKENVRLLKTGPSWPVFPQGLDYRRVDGGLLVQTRDDGADKPDEWKIVTKRKPTEAEFHALHFAWFVCKHVKSTRSSSRATRTSSAWGAGQMSRVVSVEIAVKKAGEKAKGQRAGVGRVLPLPRQRPRGRRGRRHRDHPARRLRQGQGQHRRLRPARHRDALHRREALRH